VQPEVKVGIRSDKVLSVEDFEYEAASEFRSCNVKGSIEYDISVEPKDFTGIVYLRGIKVGYASIWTDTMDDQLIFKDGKLVYGINILQYKLLDDPKVEREAVCKSKSSSDIKLISLGEALFALPGAPASAQPTSN
jgi:hypothetical protein